MKITGGSFGPSGKVRIGMGKTLIIKGAQSAKYSSDDIQSIESSTDSGKGFGVFRFLIASIILSLVGLLFLGILGLAIGFVIALAVSFKTTTSNSVSINLSDGKSVSVVGTSTEIKKLYKI